jgi:hypothetical protein
MADQLSWQTTPVKLPVNGNEVTGDRKNHAGGG